MIRISVLLCAVLFAGCVYTGLPVQIRQDLPGNPDLAAVQADPVSYKGRYVRWGGTIVSTENKQDHTWITLVARRLSQNGRPQDGDDSLGRFIVQVNQFIDPDIYRNDRKLTIFGVIDDPIQRDIGEKSYAHPLIKAESVHLWQDYDRRYVGYPYDYGYGYYPYGHFYDRTPYSRHRRHYFSYPGCY